LGAGGMAVLILAIDTATSVTALALVDRSGVLETFAEPSPQRHAEVLAPALDHLLRGRRQQVTHVVCGVGPGPFTGLRVGVASARALAHVLGVPVIGMCTLDVLARRRVATGIADECFEVVVPARRREVYAAAYDAAGQRLGAAMIRPGEQVDADPIDPIALAELARETVLSGGGLPALPLYLRDPDAVPGAGIPAAGPVSGPIIRPMRWWDIDVAARAEAELFGPTSWSPATLWSELAGVPDRRHYLIAEVAGAVAGYAGIAFAGTDADVQTVAVLPEARGVGIGTLLLTHLEAEAVARGCTRMILEVRSDNTGAIALYERAGFSADGRRRDYYAPGIDAQLMSKRLVPTGAGVP